MKAILKNVLAFPPFSGIIGYESAQRMFESLQREGMEGGMDDAQWGRCV
jgi:hypothetical protein